MPATESRKSEHARQFANGLAAIGKHPDGARKIRFIATMIARMRDGESFGRMTEQEIWRRYEEFCEKEVKAQ